MLLNFPHQANPVYAAKVCLPKILVGNKEAVRLITYGNAKTKLAFAG